LLNIKVPAARYKCYVLEYVGLSAGSTLPFLGSASIEIEERKALIGHLELFEKVESTAN
jgi:hypothetical protein